MTINAMYQEVPDVTPDARVEAVATEMAAYRPHTTGTTPIPNADELEYAEELLDAMDQAVPPQADSEKLDELLSILRPLEPVLAALPDLMAKVDPLLKGLKDSPVLKMLGVKF